MRFRIGAEDRDEGDDEAEEDTGRVSLDVESDTLSAEVESDALNAVNNYVDQHHAEDDLGSEGAETVIGEGWVSGESWEVTLYGDELGEDEDVELASESY